MASLAGGGEPFQFGTPNGEGGVVIVVYTAILQKRRYLRLRETSVTENHWSVREKVKMAQPPANKGRGYRCSLMSGAFDPDGKCVVRYPHTTFVRRLLSSHT